MIRLHAPYAKKDMPDKPKFPFALRWKKRPDEWDKTIIAVSPYALKDLVLMQGAEPQTSELETLQQQSFKIRLAHSDERINCASMLIQRMYLKRGYDVPGMQKLPARITLTASQNEIVVGTITLGIEAGNGLLADKNYKHEVDLIRAGGRQVCELTKFAVDQTHGSKRVLAALFHIAYIYGRVLQKQTDVVIEVTPKHAPFYKRMLGFEQLGTERLNSRVNTMGVLLRLEIEYVDRQIERWGGRTEAAQGERSLYPYFFSKEDEAGITQRLLQGG
ncbi:MAG: hypothetical protein ABL892_02470 [Thiobacillaceae bacterium]